MTTSASYTERYLAAATAAVPASSRTEVRAELAAAIADAIDARVDAGDDPATAEHAALTELGDPERLAADYSGRPLHLIGPRYYLAWRRLTTLLLAIVPPIVGAAVVLASVLGSEDLLSSIWSAITAALMTAGAVAFWTTVAFALAERTNPTPSGRAWTVSDLPDLRNQRMGVGELVASLTLLAVVASLVVWDQVRGFAQVDGQQVPFLDPALWPAAIIGLLVVLVAEAVLAVLVYRTGRWTLGLATANAALNLLVAIPALYLASTGQLVNPQIMDAAAGVVTSDLASTIPTVVAVAIALVAAIDIADGFVKAARARR